MIEYIYTFSFLSCLHVHVSNVGLFLCFFFWLLVSHGMPLSVATDCCFWSALFSLFLVCLQTNAVNCVFYLIAPVISAAETTCIRNMMYCQWGCMWHSMNGVDSLWMGLSVVRAISVPLVCVTFDRLHVSTTSRCQNDSISSAILAWSMVMYYMEFVCMLNWNRLREYWAQWYASGQISIEWKFIRIRFVRRILLLKYCTLGAYSPAIRVWEIAADLIHVNKLQLHIVY